MGRIFMKRFLKRLQTTFWGLFVEELVNEVKVLMQAYWYLLKARSDCKRRIERESVFSFFNIQGQCVSPKPLPNFS